MYLALQAAPAAAGGGGCHLCRQPAAARCALLQDHYQRTATIFLLSCVGLQAELPVHSQHSPHCAAGHCKGSIPCWYPQHCVAWSHASREYQQTRHGPVQPHHAVLQAVALEEQCQRRQSCAEGKQALCATAPAGECAGRRGPAAAAAVARLTSDAEALWQQTCNSGSKSAGSTEAVGKFASVCNRTRHLGVYCVVSSGNYRPLLHLVSLCSTKNVVLWVCSVYASYLNSCWRSSSSASSAAARFSASLREATAASRALRNCVFSFVSRVSKAPISRA